MSKRTRSEWELSSLPTGEKGLNKVAAPEGEPAAEGLSPLTVGDCSPKVEARTPKEVAQSEVAAKGDEGRTREEVAQADLVVEEWPGTGPFWSLLARVGYLPW